jgi:hypothetical protein
VRQPAATFGALIVLAAVLTASGGAAVSRPKAQKVSHDATIAFSGDWKQLVVSGNRPAAFKPTAVTANSPLTLTWPHEVAGELELSFGAVTPGTVIKVGFS